MNAILTVEVAQAAIDDAAPTFHHLVETRRVKRPDLHTVVCRPNMPPLTSYEEWLAAGGILCERSFGDLDHWEYPFDEIARRKAWISVRTGLPSRQVQAFCPHLLQAGDTVFGGSIVQDGLVIAASGVQAWYDVGMCWVIHGMVIARCQEIVDQERWKLDSGQSFIAEAGSHGLSDWKHDGD